MVSGKLGAPSWMQKATHLTHCMLDSYCRRKSKIPSNENFPNSIIHFIPSSCFKYFKFRETINLNIKNIVNIKHKFFVSLSRQIMSSNNLTQN